MFCVLQVQILSSLPIRLWVRSNPTGPTFFSSTDHPKSENSMNDFERWFHDNKLENEEACRRAWNKALDEAYEKLVKPSPNTLKEDIGQLKARD